MRTLVLAHAAMALVLGVAAARVWYVHPDSSLHSIQAALDSCGSGDTVLAGPGTYREQVNWPHTADLVLMSEAGVGQTVINGEAMRPGITMQDVPGSGTTVSGFQFLGCFSAGSGGAISAGACTLLIADDWFEGNAARLGGAIACSYGTTVIRRCMLIYNATMQYPPGGISFGWNHTALVESCIVTGNLGGGIDFVFGDRTTIRHCNIYGNGYGVFYSGGGGPAGNAEHNWWGDSTGPYHPTGNPGGLGDSVSDWVDFEPWLGVPIGIAEAPPAPAPRQRPGATICHSMLFLPRDMTELPGNPDRVPRPTLLDAAGRKVLDLAPGPNDVSRLAPGVYFVHEKDARGCGVEGPFRKVVIQ